MAHRVTASLAGNHVRRGEVFWSVWRVPPGLGKSEEDRCVNSVQYERLCLEKYTFYVHVGPRRFFGADTVSPAGLQRQRSRTIIEVHGILATVMS